VTASKHVCGLVKFKAELGLHHIMQRSTQNFLDLATPGKFTGNPKLCSAICPKRGQKKLISLGIP